MGDLAQGILVGVVAGAAATLLLLEIKRRLRRARKRAFRRAFEGRPSALDRDTVAGIFLKGEGIEVGALDSPATLPAGARVKYLDRRPTEELKRLHPALDTERFVEVDIVDDVEKLEKVPEASQDFLVAHHVVEHCENPIAAIANMLRVLKDGGVLCLSIPDGRYTFDAERPETPFEHLLRDHDEGPAWSRREHYEECVRFLDNVTEERTIQKMVDERLAARDNIHFHVWTQTGILELVAALRRRAGLEFEVELLSRGGVEVILVLRKAAPSPA